MKKWICLFAAMILIAAPITVAATDSTAWGPATLGGIGVAYAMHGPAQHEWFTNAYAGLKVLQIEHGALYACYQYVATESADWGGSGAKIMLADQWVACPAFTWAVGTGFLDKIKDKEDSAHTKIAGLMFDAALSYDATDWIDITGYVGAADGGPAFHFMAAVFLTIKDPQRLIPGL